MPKYVSRKRPGTGKGAVPRAWVPKYDVQRAMNEINKHIEDSVKQLKLHNAPEEDIERRKAQKLDDIGEFLDLITSEKPSVGKPVIDILDEGVSPWAGPTKVLLTEEWYPRKARFRGKKRGLEKDLLELGVYKGWRIEYPDFRVPDTLGDPNYFHYPIDIESRKKYMDEMNRKKLDNVPNYSKEPFAGKKWPGTEPQQIVFVWNKPTEPRGKEYEMVFVKSTEPIAIGGGEISWRPPNAIMTNRAYTMVREILGSQQSARTYKQEAEGSADKIKVQEIAPVDLPPETEQVRF